MAKKLNKALLNEELKKFRLLTEYSWYVNEEEPALDADTENDIPTDGAENDIPTDDSQSNVPPDDSKSSANQEAPTSADQSTPPPTPEMGDNSGLGDGMDTGSEEEVDVTELVNGSEEAKQAANSASAKTDELLKKFSELEGRISAMDSISTKIEDLEKEIIKRNPTPVEKLEMRSLSSFPYSQKLTDYWADKEGAYDVMGNNKKKEQEEYTLTKNDVDTSYNDIAIKKSFDTPIDDDYTEEEI